MLQWSETRVLALRGLSRVVRGCVKHLLVETWFHGTWVQSLEVCGGEWLLELDGANVCFICMRARFVSVLLGRTSLIWRFLWLVSTASSIQ
jgi:hypothetical protein